MTGIRRTGGQFADVHELQRVEHAIARILAETDHPVEAYGGVLEAIGSSLGWELGAVWETGFKHDRLRCLRTWHAGEGTAPEFEHLSEQIALAPGEGLPGQVLATGAPVWLIDAPADANFPRAEAARRAGLHAAFAFPLRSGRGVVGVVEFFSRERLEPDERLLRTMTAVGSQVGQFVARRHAEEEVRANESRLRAMLEAALDAVVTMDHHGSVVGWNPAAEATFGYSAEEAIGADMADLIVPPMLRESHRRGLARYLETADAVILNRRVELVGMHRSGREFPVELTITRIGVIGPPTFTGYLRDITERRQADESLRASRARLVEVADAERIRIQRNLHDGAQQRLTGVLLILGHLRRFPDDLESKLALATDELASGLQELRELASGLHPSVLSERGLAAALEALALRAPLPVELEALPKRRLPEHVESAAYYVVAEALTNAQKHANARRIVVRAIIREQSLMIEITDDGIGGANPRGSGLRGLVDRVEARGGRLSVDSPAGKGTHLLAEIPTA
jgi:PAS domain S-box-containing protein